MDLMLNDLLQLTDDEIANSRIELNMTAGAGCFPCSDPACGDKTCSC